MAASAYANTNACGLKTFLHALPAFRFAVVFGCIRLQMFDTQDWTTVADKREDRQEYSDILDEDTGFSEVGACSRNCVASERACTLCA